MQKNGPWTILGSKKIYQNNWVTIKEDKVIRPDGKKGIHWLAEEKSSTNILPIDESGKVFLINQFRYALRDWSIEVPGGVVETTESFLDCAKRELEEELGILAKKWIDLGNISPNTSAHTATEKCYIAKDLSFTKTHRDGAEIIKVMHIPFDEAVKLVMEGKVLHASSCALILKAKEFLDL